MNDAAGDPVIEATARLEAAAERLSRALAGRPAAAAAGEGPDRAAVAALAARLDDTIARLRGVLGEDA
jgi:chitinase